MTTACEPIAVAPRIVTPAFVRLLVACAGSATSFYLLLSVVPLYVAATGSAAGAGLTTGVMLLATVLTEVVMPALIARFGYRTVVAAGLVLLGAPAPLLSVSPALPLVLAVCAARGTGLAVMFVVGTALVAELVPPGRRGEALGVYGIAVGMPAVLGLPLGVYLSGRVGFGPVFALAAVVALAGLAAAPGLPGRPTVRGAHSRVLRGIGSSGLVRLAVVFGAVTLAAGVVLTFLPVAVPAEQTRLVAAALFVQAVLAPAARWAAGRYGDRRGYRGLLIPSVVLTAMGVAALASYRSPVAVLAGMVAFGIGYGAAQSITLAMMFARAGHGEHGRVSALWNLVFDLGMAVGATVFGLVAGATGYAAAFVATALVVAGVLAPAWRERRG
jgi:MFS family permease